MRHLIDHWWSNVTDLREGRDHSTFFKPRAMPGLYRTKVLRPSTFAHSFLLNISWLLCSSTKPQKTTNIKVVVVKSMATTSSSTFIREILSRRDEWKVQIASCKWHSCGLSLVLGPHFLLFLLTSPMAMTFDLEISKVAWSISSSADPTNCWVSVKWHVSCWV